MSELRTYWEEYKKIELSGAGRIKRCYELEKLIHEKQKEIGSEPYDFDKRWEKHAQMATPTVSGTTIPTEKPEAQVKKAPQANFTLDEAREIIGENDCQILDDCAKVAEARMVYLAYVLDKLNPDNSNVARRGQAINVAITEFNKRKDL